MANLLYVHWNEQEAAVFSAALRRAGHTVHHHAIQGGAPPGDVLPDAVVISLDRLPSHGREVARWFSQAKKRQSIPVVFVGGDPRKISAFRDQFPRAIFCAAADLPGVLSRTLGGGTVS
jgi:hypothetical protein